MNALTTRLLLLVLIIVGAVPLSACGALSGPAVEGQVLEAGTDRPIPGAIVVVRWRVSVSMLVDSQDACVHVDSAVTDENGRYRLPAWRKPSNVGPTVMVSSAAPLAVAYKTGYEEARYASHLVVYLRPSAQTRKERLEYISRVSSATRCGEAGGSGKNLLLIDKALYEEANRIAVTKEERLKVLYRLRDVERIEIGSEKAWENFRNRQEALE